jgi:hypothetical protein
MNNKNRKWLLAVVAVCCLAPAAFAHRNPPPPPPRCEPSWAPKCQHSRQSVPEGGSTAIYLLGAGLTCAGAMFLRSRLAKPTQS